MKVAVLGANWSPCAEPIDQTVVPATGLPSSSVQVKAVPPHSWTSIPRCRLYQRSEEHTSELQSQSNLVCRLLLEKKKKIDTLQTQTSIKRTNSKYEVNLMNTSHGELCWGDVHFIDVLFLHRSLAKTSALSC